MVAQALDQAGGSFFCNWEFDDRNLAWEEYGNAWQRQRGHLGVDGVDGSGGERELQ